MNRIAHILKANKSYLLVALLLLAPLAPAPAAVRTSPTLPNLSINALAQDDKGFVWIATDNGLCRYNGQNYLQFNYDPNTDSSLPSNEVHDVKKDRAGNIWAATNKAVCIYEPGSRTFRRLSVESDDVRLCATDEGMACYGPRGIVFFDVSGNVLHRADSPLHRLSLLLRDDDGGLLGLNVDGIHISKLRADGEIVRTGSLEITLKEGAVSVQSLGSTPVTDLGSSFNNARLLQDRKLFLNYSYDNPDGTRTVVKDTLTFRNRIRDGVDEWQDTKQEHYK